MSNIITTQITVPKESDSLFSDWQAEIHHCIHGFPGFLSLEILSPEAMKAPCWTLVQRFEDGEGAQNWFTSEERKKLFHNLQAHSAKIKIEDVAIDASAQKGVTEIIVTQVDPDKREEFKRWIAKMHLAESKFPGFRALFVQSPVQSPPDKKGHQWITLLQFDTIENLDKWLLSDERQEILQELGSTITALETHRVTSPFGGWFSSIAKVGSLPPVWKQTLLVLLVLFPIVMLEFRFLNPYLKGLNISLATFIGNAISVSLISWPGLPLVIRGFRFWLNPDIRHKKRTNLIGTALLGLMYLLETLIFWNFV